MANVTVVMTAEEAGLWRAHQRILDQQKKLEDGYRKTGEAGGRMGDKVRGAGQEHNKAFGSQAVSQLKNYVLGLVSVTAGITSAVAAFRSVQRVQEEAAAAARFARLDVGALSQLATTTEEMADLRKRAQRVFAMGGAETMGEAARIVYAVQSAQGGRKEDLLFGQMAATGVVPEGVDLMAKNAQMIIRAFGREEAGGFREVLSKAFGATPGSPEKTEQLLRQAAKAGGAFGAIGISDEEVLAATTLVSEVYGERTGEKIAALGRRMGRMPEYRGKTLEQFVTGISGQGLPREQLMKVFPDQQALEAFDQLAKNMPVFQRNLANIQEAQRTDVIGQKLRFAVQNPVEQAALLERIERNRLTLSKQQLSVNENLYQAARSATLRAERGAGASEAALAWKGFRLGTERFFAGPRHMIQTMEGLPPDLQQAIGEQLQRTSVVGQTIRRMRGLAGEVGPLLQDPEALRAAAEERFPPRMVERFLGPRSQAAIAPADFVPAYLPTGEQIGLAAGRIIAGVIGPGLPPPPIINETVRSALAAPRTLSPGLAIDR